jgi:hypothetical protein
MARPVAIIQQEICQLGVAATVQSGEAHTRGLGAGLKAETQRVTQLLLQTPLIGEIVGRAFRRFPLRQLPFALIYRIDGDRLRTLAVDISFLDQTTNSVKRVARAGCRCCLITAV